MSNKNLSSHLKAFWAAAFFALASVALCSPVLAQNDKAEASSQKEMVPWNIVADVLSSEHDSEVIEAKGNVELWSGSDYLQADFARYYKSTNWVYLRGNVKASWGTESMTAEEAEFDLKNSTGWLKNGTVFVEDPHLYFKGEHIERRKADTYAFKNANVTACDTEDGSSPAWSIDMDEGEITLEGYAWLWHPRLKVKDVPAIYSPLMILPAKRERQSGLLFPEYGNSSRLGAFYHQPIYWAIDEESDATFTETYMSERGFMQGLEYRHTPSPDTKGVWRFDYLRDNTSADDPRDEDSQFKGDGLTRGNKDRYWWRSKYDGHIIDPRWKVKLDIDWVSDQNYLREFKLGHMEHAANRQMFLDEFHRDIDNADDLTRESSALVQRDWDRVGVAGKVQWTQNLNYRNGNNPASENDTLQRLPDLHAYVWKDQLFATPLEWQLDTSASNFWRRYGTKGTRVEAHPKISLPVQTGPVSVIPTLGLRETGYFVDEYENRSVATDDGETTARHLPNFDVTAFTEVYKVYEMDSRKELVVHRKFTGDDRWTAIRHSIQPRIGYKWTPQISQTNKPFFDDLDRISGQNELTYSLANILDYRQDTVVNDKGDLPENAKLSSSYGEFLRLLVEQSYDQREATRNDERDTYSRRPFSDIMAELQFTPKEYLTLSARSFWSPYLGELTQQNFSATLEEEGLGSATAGIYFQEAVDEYKRKARQRIRQLNLGVNLDISDRWSTGFRYRSDLESSEDLEKTASVTFKHQCWTLTLYYTVTPYEERYHFQVKLLNFGV